MSMMTISESSIGPATDTGAGGLHRHSCTVFGCDVELLTVGVPRTPFDDVERHLRELEGRFSRFEAGNELDRLVGADGRWVETSAEMRRLLEHALRVAVESQGLVNIAVTTAVRAAGYVASWPAPWSEPSPGVEPVSPLTEVLELRPGQARLRKGCAIDFGALAKGLWADDVVELLGDNAAAGLGGDVAAHGRGPDGEGWPIGLPGGRTVSVHDGGVATSGTTKRAHGEAHHVIDPRTGRPSVSRSAEVSVLASCATTAEWIATALLIDAEDPAGLGARSDVHAVFTSLGRSATDVHQEQS